MRIAILAGAGAQARALVAALRRLPGLEIDEVRGRIGIYRSRPEVLHAVGAPPPRLRPCPAVASVASIDRPPQGAPEVILCPSPFVARELEARHGVDPARLRVVLPAPVLPVGDAPPSAGGYVLGVGAGAGVRAPRPGEDLDALLRGADVFVYAERDAAFGALALEAMVRGVPVAAVRSGALPETCGDAAELFDPGDEAGAIERARARRDELAAAGRAHAALFDWHATAQATALTYLEVRALSSGG